MKINLTRKQELKLIEMGMQQVLDSLAAPIKTTSFKKQKWTPAQRRKFAQTMSMKYGKKFKKN